MKRLKTKDLVLSALFCALMAVGAQVTVPTPYGMITLQLFFAVLAGLMLPPMISFLSMAVYFALGLVGVPVFAGFSGGFSAVLSPTFGFIIGMMVSAPVVSALFSWLKKRIKAFGAALAAGFIAVLITYAFGAVYGYFIMTLVLSKEATFGFIILNWCLIYLPFDALKIVGAAIVAPPLLRRIPKKA